MKNRRLRIFSYPLTFKKPARTSRNVFENRTVYFLIYEEGSEVHVGEAAPLEKLSFDAKPEFSEVLRAKTHDWFKGIPLEDLELENWPAIRFALESLELSNQGPWQIPTPMKINGLVWMNTIEAMYEEAIAKVEAGFQCIKFKVGALDFDEECRLIERIRKMANAFKLEIRLDANGAFQTSDALEKLNDLSRFEIHSLEQPIAPKQWEAMYEVCAKSKIPIALDEELIYASAKGQHSECLQFIKPQYIILKPSLIGGFSSSNMWIDEAKKLNIPWWATSALESNIGLTAITKWVGSKNNPLPQGLGTGSLYTNNIASPFQLQGEWANLNPYNAFDVHQILKEGQCIFETVE